MVFWHWSQVSFWLVFLFGLLLVSLLIWSESRSEEAKKP